ncbi:MAG: glycoside hydrolase family 5 protein, partial [Bacteroidota bacterium]
PAPTEFKIRKVAELGFRTLRIPVTWAFHMREFAPYQVESAYLDRVQYIVNLALDNQMHVIINVHHDDEWILPTYQDSSRTKDRLAGLWTQIAERFQPYGDSLIFETINEPRLKGSPEEWSGGTEEGRTVLNTYHKAALDAIRATGGNNTKRHIMISTYAASSVPAAMDALVIPNDDPNVIISTHSYFPWSFCGDENGPSSWGTEEERSGLIAEIDRIYNYWVVERNRPVVLGEWGARDKNNVDIRADYFSIYTREATTRGMVPIVWDDGGNFRLLDRTGVVWEFQKLVDAIVDSAQ